MEGLVRGISDGELAKIFSAGIVAVSSVSGSGKSLGSDAMRYLSGLLLEECVPGEPAPGRAGFPESESDIKRFADRGLFTIGFFSSRASTSPLRRASVSAAYVTLGGSGLFDEVLGWPKAVYSRIGSNLEDAMSLLAGVSEIFSIASGRIDQVSDVAKAAEFHEAFLMLAPSSALSLVSPGSMLVRPARTPRLDG